ncbi:MAG: CPBP family intramembrane glutamic endopeptidase [Candidatus Thalassarchaeaceae archaeon]
MKLAEKPLIAILLVGFVPSISVIFGISIIEDELFSQIFFAACKIWIFLVPTIWYLKVEKNPISINIPSKNGIKMALITGILMSVIILVTWFLFEDTLDVQAMVKTLQSRGFDSINLYILGMIYWIFINSLLEEYVFRWFITTKSAEIFDSEMTGIIFSALIFTLHHAIALHLFGFVWWQTVLASFGLISAAIIWSWLYIKYRSIWVCWLSHAICDVAVFGIGYVILF